MEVQSFDQKPEPLTTNLGSNQSRFGQKEWQKNGKTRLKKWNNAAQPKQLTGWPYITSGNMGKHQTRPLKPWEFPSWNLDRSSHKPKGSMATTNVSFSWGWCWHLILVPISKHILAYGYYFLACNTDILALHLDMIDLEWACHLLANVQTKWNGLKQKVQCGVQNRSLKYIGIRELKFGDLVMHCKVCKVWGLEATACLNHEFGVILL